MRHDLINPCIISLNSFLFRDAPLEQIGVFDDSFAINGGFLRNHSVFKSTQK